MPRWRAGRRTLHGRATLGRSSLTIRTRLSVGTALSVLDLGNRLLKLALKLTESLGVLLHPALHVRLEVLHDHDGAGGVLRLLLDLRIAGHELDDQLGCESGRRRHR